MEVATKEENNTMAEIWAASLLKENPILISKLKKLSFEEPIDPQELLTEVVKFLYLVSILKAKLSPSLTVDLGWHEFILFTRPYQEFCQSKLGRFVHHVPDDNKASNNRAFLKTIQYYISYFDKPPKHIWGTFSHTEWEDAQCGSCNAH